MLDPPLDFILLVLIQTLLLLLTNIQEKLKCSSVSGHILSTVYPPFCYRGKPWLKLKRSTEVVKGVCNKDIKPQFLT